MTDRGAARIVYGVYVGNVYDSPALVEAVFSTEAAAREYARRRSAERYRNSGRVSCWELDNPERRTWLVSYQDGEQRDHNNRAIWPPRRPRSAE